MSRSFLTLTLTEAIQSAARKLAECGIKSSRLDAEVLLSHVLQQNRAWVFTHIHDEFSVEGQKLFFELIDRRSRREPLQYIVGRQEFWALEFSVTPSVLIPRPETELVVESASRILQDFGQPTVIDLCTGSGCIAVSLAKRFPNARLFATDKSEPALRIAQENARLHEVAGQIRFLEGDLFQPFEELDLSSRADAITANPPYVPVGDLAGLQPEVRDYEPGAALAAGPEGTEFHQRIIRQAPAFLKRGGALVMEMGIGQAEPLAKMAEEAGAYSKPEILKDLAGIDRVIILRKKV